MQQGEPANGQSEDETQNLVMAMTKVSDNHAVDEDNDFLRIGPADTTTSSKTLCTHRTSLSSVALKNQSTVAVQRPPTSSNGKPEVPSLLSSSSSINPQCTCPARSANSLEGNAPIASTIEAVESPSEPASHLSPLDTKGPLHTRRALGGSVAQPLRLIERREKHKVDARIRNAFQQELEKVGDEMDTEWWLKLATWWSVKVGLTSDRNGFDTNVTCLGLSQSCTVRRILASTDPRREQDNGTLLPSLQNSWRDAVSLEQSFADLLKSSWILEDVILVRHGSNEPLNAKIRKSILDLSTVSQSVANVFHFQSWRAK